MGTGSKLLWTAATFFVTGLVLVVVLQSVHVREDPAYESIMPTFPAPEDLSPAKLPAFDFRHPRLPAPSSSDITTLLSKSADFFHRHIRRRHNHCRC